jgi:hypothetical protein
LIGLIVPMLALAAGTEPLMEQDPALAWQRYLRAETTIEPDLLFPHSRCFRRASRLHDLPETLLLAVARGESDFDATARSRANAHGVMQIQWPGTARHLGIHRLSVLYDPCTNIDAGARYLSELLERYDGNLHLALAAYNYGPSRIPRGATSIPSGAAWYSAYIYRHLDYVLGDRRNEPSGLSLYSDLGRSVLLSFGEPYRAVAFIERVHAAMPAQAEPLQLDWFRRATGRFDVVFTYADKDAYETGASHLSRAGFPVD